MIACGVLLEWHLASVVFIFYIKFCNNSQKTVMYEIITAQNRIIAWLLPISLSYLHFLACNAASCGNWNRLTPSLEQPSAVQHLTISIVWILVELYIHSYSYVSLLIIRIHLMPWKHTVPQTRRNHNNVKSVQFSMVYFTLLMQLIQPSTKNKECG